MRKDYAFLYTVTKIYSARMFSSNHPSAVQASWFSKNPKKTLTVLMVIILVLLDFTATVAYRYVTKGTIAKRVSFEPNGLRTRHHVYHHDLNPNQSHPRIEWRNEKYSFFTNSLGFRDSQVRSISLSTEKYRIVFMGDSFTEGAAVNYEDSFVGRVAREFGEDIEVLNAGVVSYSPAIYFMKTQYLINQIGLTFDHMVVSIDISDIIDDGEFYSIEKGKIVSNRYSPSGFRQSWLLTPFFDVIHDYTTIGRLIVHYFSKAYDVSTKKGGKHFRSEEEKALGAGRPEGMWTINQSIYSEFGKKGLENAERHMSMLHELLNNLGITMTLVVYPWPDQILHQDLRSIQSEFWEKWANEHSVNFVNLFPLFIQQDQSKSERINTIEDYYYEADVHWNKQGNQLVSKELLKKINAILPSLRKEPA